jgi:tubulin polyglutamylase TTLL1
VFSDLNIIRERRPGIPKKAIKAYTFDLINNLKRKRAGDKILYPHTWPLSATVLFMHYDDLNSEYHYGKGIFTFEYLLEILCLFQKFNHLPGKYSISHKNNLMNNFHTYKDKLIQDKKPE